MVSLDFALYLISLIFARLRSIGMAVSDKRMNEKASFKPFFPKEKKMSMFLQNQIEHFC